MSEKLPQEIQALQDIINRAETSDIAVYRELKKSQALVEQEFYTEAALRLGRSVEASIYSTARDLGVSVSVAGLGTLDQIGDKIKVAQVTIAQGQVTDGIKKLLECISDLVRSVDLLVESNNSQQSIAASRERPLPNRQLYKAFQEQIGRLPENNGTFDRNAIRKRLGMESSQVDELLQIRNKAAHPSLDGNEREVDMEEYINLVGKVSTVIATLFDIKLILQSIDR
ncbi:hypothetical protein [Pseudanabaena sp. UWO310]|uniref:hypothetical protein n=1 Tax=Pseudanabaena sp. UWO310 TaxID=2480795 RepID=UPI001680CF44|nr:hypothetical protein [Pseudanabaena sp. UWO310]